MWNNYSAWGLPKRAVPGEQSDLPPDIGRPILSRFTPAPPDDGYLAVRDQLYSDFLNGAQKMVCSLLEKRGVCGFPECPFMHGLVCETCDRPVLDPVDKAQQAFHIEECRRLRPSCSICFSAVRTPQNRDQIMYGILNNCPHAFCYPCISRWRKTQSNVDTRACPVCRIVSQMVCPNPCWVDSGIEKQKLFSKYKTKKCKYVANGMGEYCPYREACLFRHHEIDDGNRTIIASTELHSMVNIRVLVRLGKCLKITEKNEISDAMIESYT